MFLKFAFRKKHGGLKIIYKLKKKHYTILSVTQKQYNIPNMYRVFQILFEKNYKKPKSHPLYFCHTQFGRQCIYRYNFFYWLFIPLLIQVIVLDDDKWGVQYRKEHHFDMKNTADHQLDQIRMTLQAICNYSVWMIYF